MPDDKKTINSLTEAQTRIKKLELKLLKKKKIIAALSTHVENLTNKTSNIFNDLQTTSALEQTVQTQEIALTKAARIALQTQSTLETERAHTRITLSSLKEGVITVDTNNIITYINLSAEQLLKKEHHEAIGEELGNIFLLLDEQTRLPIVLPTEEISAIHDLTDIEISSQPILLRGDDSEIAIDWLFAPIQNEHGIRLGSVITFHDVTDEHNLKLKLKHQATHDSLTGLLNRAEFDRRLKNILTATHDLTATHSLIYIDLDQFKIVNDTCGHHAGDQLLKQLTSLISPKIRGRDTLARLGGDEFAVLLEYCPQDISLRIANELLHTIQDFRFLWSEKAFDVGASMGVVHFSSADIASDDPLSAADAACYKAKELGRNRIHEVNLLLGHKSDSVPHGEMGWVAKINSAIEENRLVLYQQTIAPIHPSNEHQINYEILIRMKDKEGQLIPPGAFLPAAERYNIISKVDRYVIAKTFKWLSEHPVVLNKTRQCSINLSGPSLSDNGLPKFVKQCFEEFNIPFQKICFEITETSVIQNLDIATNFMKGMQELGCSFALDDFGTGMSSFSYLKQLPVNKLKIDGTFVRDITHDPIDLAMTRSINEIGHVMGMETIAEFVENAEILNLLKQLGVDYAQGYHIAKPEPFEALLDN